MADETETVTETVETAVSENGDITETHTIEGPSHELIERVEAIESSLLASATQLESCLSRLAAIEETLRQFAEELEEEQEIDVSPETVVVEEPAQTVESSTEIVEEKKPTKRKGFRRL